MREVKRKQECARHLFAWLSLAGNAWRWRLPAIATAYANPRTFTPTAEHTSNFVCEKPPVHRTRPSILLSTRLARARDFITCGTSCIATYIRTNTPTRDGHAPKRSLITSILLPLTAHYRASRESFLLIYVDCRSRKRVERDHQEFASPLEIRARKS